MSQSVLVERQGAIATVAFNRPERMNSLTAELVVDLLAQLRELATDDDVRCVVLTGTGDRAFSAGADLSPDVGTPSSAAPDTPFEEAVARVREYEEISWLLHTMPKPTLAAINGAVAGGSLSIALACDLRVAAEHAIFTTAFAKVGFPGDYGGTFFLSKILGSAKARELYLLSDRIDAQEALQLGMVNRVFPRAEFRKEAAEYACRLSEGPRGAIRDMKRALNLALTSNLREVINFEAEATVRAGRSDDVVQAKRAFMAKEKPDFTRG